MLPDGRFKDTTLQTEFEDWQKRQWRHCLTVKGGEIANAGTTAYGNI